MYKADILYQAYEDNYNKGEIGDCVNSWEATATAKTKAELKTKILEATYTDKWEDVNHEDANEYPNWSEYWSGYYANADNQGDATPSELEQWKLGKEKLYRIDCHILVSKVTERKAVL